MTHVDTGIYGAKRQSFEENNPRDLLVRVMAENRGASEATLLKRFTEAVRDDADYIGPIIGYWFANNYRSARRASPQERAASAKVQTRLVETIKRAVLSISLDFVMPNGKPLRDCTGGECARAGGWFAKIAKRVKPNQVVGNVLSDSDLKKIVV